MPSCDGRDDLEEAVADREHDVGEPELAHARIAERLAETELLAQPDGCRLQLGGDEHRLAQPQHERPRVMRHRLPAAFARRRDDRGPADNQRIASDPEQRAERTSRSSHLRRLAASANWLVPAENPSRAVLGVIVTGALLAAESGLHETYLDTFASGALAAVLYWLAHALRGRARAAAARARSR